MLANLPFSFIFQAHKYLVFPSFHPYLSSCSAAKRYFPLSSIRLCIHLLAHVTMLSWILVLFNEFLFCSMDFKDQTMYLFGGNCFIRAPGCFWRVPITLWAYACCYVQSLSHVWLFATPRTVASLSVEHPGQEHWSASPLPSPAHRPGPGTAPRSPAAAGAFFSAEPPGKLEHMLTWHKKVFHVFLLLSLPPP